MLRFARKSGENKSMNILKLFSGKNDEYWYVLRISDDR